MKSLASVFGSAWCMTPDALEAIGSAFDKWISSGCPKGESVIFASRKVAAGTGRSAKSVAVLSLQGVIAQHNSPYLEWVGGTSTEDFGHGFDAAIADESVKSIVIDINSPGGQVSGTPELASKIYKARGCKPIIGVASSLAASAGYWIGSAVDKLYVTPSGYVGSIGVLSMHEDYSKAMEDAGVKITITRIPKYKAEGNPYEPAGEEFLASEIADISRIYGDFVAAVAKHRGASIGDVKEKFGQGRIVDAKAALAAGMVDGIATVDDIVQRAVDNQIRVDAGRRAIDAERIRMAMTSHKK